MPVEGCGSVTGPGGVPSTGAATALPRRVRTLTRWLRHGCATTALWPGVLSTGCSHALRFLPQAPGTRRRAPHSQGVGAPVRLGWRGPTSRWRRRLPSPSSAARQLGSNTEEVLPLPFLSLVPLPHPCFLGSPPQYSVCTERAAQRASVRPLHPRCTTDPQGSGHLSGLVRTARCAWSPPPPPGLSPGSRLPTVSAASASRAVLWA